MNLLECVELIEETKENSKNALIEKGVELDDSYKLSQVDEKIAEIKSGGGSTGNSQFHLTKVTLSSYYDRDITTSNKQQISVDSDSGFNLKIEYSFDGDYWYKGLLLTSDYDYSNNRDISSGNSSETFNNLTAKSDFGVTYFIIFYDKDNYDSEVVFTFNLYNSSDW